MTVSRREDFWHATLRLRMYLGCYVCGTDSFCYPLLLTSERHHLVVPAAPLVHDVAAVLAASCCRDSHGDRGWRNGHGSCVGAFAALSIGW